MNQVKTSLFVFTVSIVLITAIQSGCTSIPISPEPSDSLTVATSYSQTDDGTVTSTTAGNPRGLLHVTHWLYLIDVNLEQETVGDIEQSAYDMVVLDFIPSEKWNTGYPMEDVIEQLHLAPRPKLVIAYVDIGQAEDYRTYWQAGWQIGNPGWIVGEDPDGWEGNYPVAYWHDEWREIWLGENGYLKQIIDIGFDGVYLDWIEAYSDDNVADFAAGEGVDAVGEMLEWIGDIAEFTRLLEPGFIIIAQNAAELVETGGREYLDLIDALAQEQTWFDGSADNVPPGDCPLPETDDDIDTPEYYDSLSRECKDYFDEHPDGTLHVSTEEYLHYLTMARDMGEVVLTVDYAQDPANVALVYQTSRSMGFIPFVSNRALDTYIEPYIIG